MYTNKRLELLQRKFARIKGLKYVRYRIVDSVIVKDGKIECYIDNTNMSKEDNRKISDILWELDDEMEFNFDIKRLSKYNLPSDTSILEIKRNFLYKLLYFIR